MNFYVIDFCDDIVYTQQGGSITTSVKWFLEKCQFQLHYNVSATLLQRLLYGILRNFNFNHFTTFLQRCYNVC
jgi:hypothetical protein